MCYIRKILLSTVVVIVFLAFAHSVGNAASDDKGAVLKTLQDNAAAFEQKDISALDKLWVNDDSVIVFESGNADYGWANYRNHHLVPEMQELKNVKYLLSDIKPSIDGNTAWATFRYSISADLPERHVEASGVGTAILQKKENRWLIIHWHTSSPRKPQPDQNKEEKKD